MSSYIKEGKISPAKAKNVGVARATARLFNVGWDSLSLDKVDKPLYDWCTGKDPYLCPCCDQGEMVIIAIIPGIRGSPLKPPPRFFAKDRKVAIR